MYPAPHQARGDSGQPSSMPCPWAACRSVVRGTNGVYLIPPGPLPWGLAGAWCILHLPCLLSAGLEGNWALGDVLLSIHRPRP